MAKTVNYDRVEEPIITREVIPADNGEIGDDLRFYPMRKDYICTIVSDDGTKKEKVFRSDYYGKARMTKYTLPEVYQWMGTITNMHLISRNKLKDFVFDAINEDLSV